MAKQENQLPKEVNLLKIFLGSTFARKVLLNPALNKIFANFIAKIQRGELSQKDFVQALKTYIENQTNLTEKDKQIVRKVISLIDRFRKLRIMDRYVSIASKSTYHIEDLYRELKIIYDSVNALLNLNVTKSKEKCEEELAEKSEEFNRVLKSVRGDKAQAKIIRGWSIAEKFNPISTMVELIESVLYTKEHLDRLKATLFNMYVQSKLTEAIKEKKTTELSKDIIDEATKFAESIISDLSDVIRRLEPKKTTTDWVREYASGNPKFCEDLHSMVPNLKVARKKLERILDLIERVGKKAPLYGRIIEFEIENPKQKSLKKGIRYNLRAIPVMILLGGVSLLIGLSLAYVTYKKMYNRSPFSKGFIKGINELFKHIARDATMEKLGVVGYIIFATITIGLLTLLLVLPLIIAVILYDFYKSKQGVGNYVLKLSNDDEKKLKEE